MEHKARYYENVDSIGSLDVVFIVKKTGRALVKSFDSPYLAKQFVERCRKGKKCLVVSYPNWYF